MTPKVTVIYVKGSGVAFMSKHKSSNRKLPPLLSVSPVSSRMASSKSHRSPHSSSRYHKNCSLPIRLHSPGPGAYLDVVSVRSPMPRTPKSPRLYGRKSATTISRKVITEYLEMHKDFLEDYVLNNVDIELLERWLIRKNQKEYKEKENDENTKENLSYLRWKFCVHADKREMLQELTNTLYTCPNKSHVLTELARTVASSVNANSWTLYIYEQDAQELCAFRKEIDGKDSNQELQVIPMEAGASLAAYVARTKEPTRIKSKDLYLRFPDGVPVSPDRATFILCHPILQPDGELTGVLELYRTAIKSEFREEDEEVVNSYLVWGEIALHYAELYGSMMRQRELSSFLLSIVRSIFQDMMSMDSLIINIMTFARKLVNADRASLFLVDTKSRELFARIFDVSGNNDEEEMPNETGFKSCNEIRFPIGKGIAGYVAMTGESLNIKDAYNDERFNRSVDQQTGYITRNLLCMPIFIRGRVIGVVQMVNKMTGPFTKVDEEAFTTFAVYCGLALHHAKLYDKIQRSQQKYKVALEILSYHYTCSDDEIKKMNSLKLSIRPEALRDFKFCPSVLSSDEKVVASIFMFNDLFRHHSESSVKLESDYLLRFTLTVRKNYRRVPYHNWAHGFTVANSAYAVLYHCQEIFTPLEELAIFVACLCHDLDHRGKTNQFLSNSAAPLAAIYTTSTLEHHHFNMTVSILQQEGHNILRNLSSAEYKQVLSNIKHCILATDLARFFPNKAKLSEIVKSDNFDWNFVEHRLLLQSIIMTACDLCASTKSWDQQMQTVNVIFEEFYEQGDVERNQGKEPIPMMDRTKIEEQPSSQVGFLRGICVPCYELLYTVLPQVKPFFDGCQENLTLWLAEAEKDKNEKEESSRVNTESESIAVEENAEEENDEKENAEKENAEEGNAEEENAEEENAEEANVKEGNAEGENSEGENAEGENAEGENAEEENTEEENAERENAEEENAEEENAEEKNTVQEDTEEENAEEKNTVQEDTEEENAEEKNTVQEDTEEENAEEKNAVQEDTEEENAIEENT